MWSWFTRYRSDSSDIPSVKRDWMISDQIADKSRRSTPPSPTTTRASSNHDQGTLLSTFLHSLNDFNTHDDQEKEEQNVDKDASVWNWGFTGSKSRTLLRDGTRSRVSGTCPEKGNRETLSRCIKLESSHRLYQNCWKLLVVAPPLDSGHCSS